MIALFLLAGVVLVLVSLLHSLLRYGRQVEMQSLAALAAEKRIEEIRDWSRQKTGSTYRFENLVTTYAGTTTTDPQFPGFTLTTQARLQPLDLPGSTLEQSFTDKQRLNASAVLLRVWVTWGNGSNLQVTTLVAAPARRPDATLTISQVNGANPVPAHADAVFRVTARDVDGQDLPDLTYRWYILPETGNASIFLNRRDTTEGKLINHVRYPTGQFEPAPGTCRIGVRSLYRGQELVGVSSPVSLAP